MAIAKKCDRCGRLYEYYEDIECNNQTVNKIHTVHDFKKEGYNITAGYDLCQYCCLDFVIWITFPETEVVRKDRNKVDTVLYAEGEKILTQKANGEIEWHNQINVDGADINPEYIMDNIVLENKEEIENGEC